MGVMFILRDAIRHVKIKTTVFNMLKRLDKIRSRGQRTDVFLDLGDSPNTSDTECSEEILMKPRPSLEMKDTEEVQDPAGPGTLTMPAAAIQDYQRAETDRLNDLKGHLEIALLEKHFLQEELRKLREETNIDTLKQELEKEKSKRLDLEQKLNLEVLKMGPEDSPSQRPRETPPPPTANDTEGDHVLMAAGVAIQPVWSVHRGLPFPAGGEHSGARGAAKRLTENMRRLKRDAKPVINFKRNLFALSSWQSVYTSAFAFIIYMNAAWHGWAVPMFIFLAILRLSLNYLISRGWRIQWSIVPGVSEPVEPPKEDLTVSEKFQLVLDVAQKAQNLFGKMADVLEKIKNLFMWVHPEFTQKLYVGLWVALICSCLIPYKLMGFMIGLYAGIKFFIIDFMFRSCPKLRDKYDTPHIIWTNLPTDPQLKEHGGAALSRRLSGCEKIHPTVAHGSLGTALPCGISLEEQTGRAYNTKKGAFHEVFNLSGDERPLAVCENGWRCCLINRDRKSPTDYIRNGVLFVTENYLCFEGSSCRSNSSKKNKVIKLIDITDIQKYKVLSVLPGSGMGISIATPSTQKPLVFGAMIHRDEAFDAIFTQYTKKVTMTTATNPET
ncbi:GRAM domain-containing protein 4-like isoform X3 [Salvelinus alpinus]|uniref:GRAM domain-containing protein 4-like isoform X3 n=1 Tax=Salvelinus alpinus TaxID=8036 RepID=UPI0039FD99EB